MIVSTVNLGRGLRLAPLGAASARLSLFLTPLGMTDHSSELPDVHLTTHIARFRYTVGLSHHTGLPSVYFIIRLPWSSAT